MAVSQVPDAVPELREWVEGIASKKSYSKHVRGEHLKGRWEAQSHGEIPSMKGQHLGFFLAVLLISFLFVVLGNEFPIRQ